MNHTRTLRLLAPLATLLLAALLSAASASAAYEQVGCFAGTSPSLTGSCQPVEEEKFGEEVQLGGVGAMAVNYTGAGEVPKGSVFAIGNGPEGAQVSMYVPNPDGGLAFKLRWRVTGHPGTPLSRCGPALEANCKPTVEGGAANDGISVDQTTGNVYTYVGEDRKAERLVSVYSPEGTSEITGFGEYAATFGEATSVHPEQVHNGGRHDPLVVSPDGTVYLVDVNLSTSDFYQRLMVFKPETPGNYEHYAYVGEILGKTKSSHYYYFPRLDDAGNIYVASEEEVQVYSPQAPSAYPAPPVAPTCKYKFAKSGIRSLAVNPQSGEAFFDSYKLPKRIRRLGPCDPSTGRFTEIEPEPEALTITPERDDLWALAFDPVRRLTPGRAPGVLYGGAPGPTSNDAVGDGEPGQSSLGYIFAHSEETPPEILVESVTHVTATEAILRSTINPHGFNTEYRFQYLTQAEYEANPPEDPFAGAAESGGVIPAAQGGKNVSEAIASLIPDTAYRFRVVATSHCAGDEPEKACTVSGGARPFRTYPAGPKTLPDGRAWELVSPAQKHGGQVLPASGATASCYSGCKPGAGFLRFPVQSDPAGDSIAYEGSPFGLDQGGDHENEYVSRRDPNSGWSTENPTPQFFDHSAQSLYSALDPTLTQAVVVSGWPVQSPVAADGSNLFMQALADPTTLRAMLGTAAPHRTAEELQLRYAGASTDLTHVFFAANDALTGEVPGVAPAAEDGGVNKLNIPTFNLYEWDQSTGEVRLVNVLPGNAGTEAGASFGNAGAHGVSADGSRVFFEDEDENVYLRENAETTYAVPGSGPGAGFLAAATDGSRVLLTNGLVYDFGTEATTDLTRGKGGFQGLSGQSDDLEQLYFVDTEILTGEAENGEGDKAQAGKPNLYSWGEGSTTFVGTLEPEDNDDLLGSSNASWKRIPSERSAKASPSGRFLTFSSRAKLTSYDNTGPCKVLDIDPIIVAPSPCREVYLYDSATEQLRCASCNPSEATPINRSTLPIVEGPVTQAQPNYLSDSGRLFFDSQDSLSPLDSNEGVEDTYEYEPAGVGSCQRAEGCVSLISAGTGEVDSNFLAADPNGENVFFTTRSRLVPRDTDELIDVYDARVGGGLAIDQAGPLPSCQGSGCQQAAPPPAAASPSSSSLVGGGNVRVQAKHCKKPKMRRHGRCVKKPQGHRHKHRKHKRPQRAKGGHR